MAIPNLANTCILDLMEKMQSVPAFQKKVIFAYTQDELYDVAQQLNFPCAGVLYEGMRSLADTETRTVPKGYSVELSCTILLLVSGKTIGNADYKVTALEILEQFRDAIKNTRAPSAFYWKFVLESAVESRKDSYSYAQRWTTTAILT
jgi:hypothetical protein